ncbi:MAG: hypothetical protein IJ861_00490 [Clostridia bacterium]|nr:hypothetical protein [Clostridia bacterium]
MKLSERAAYIKGLIDGLELDPKDKQTKVFRLIAELLGDMAEEIGELEQCYDDVCDQIDGIGEDLAGVEDIIYDEDYDGGIDYSKSGESSDLAYETTCPSCDTTISLSEASLNMGSIKCPNCGEVLEFDYDPDELDSDVPEQSAEE